MEDRKKGIAKFFAGFSANQIMVHWGLGLADKLPLDFGFVTLTENVNTIGMILWPVIFMLLVYWGWIKK